MLLKLPQKIEDTTPTSDVSLEVF